MKAISQQRLFELNQGLVESSNLGEALKVDFLDLYKYTFPKTCNSVEQVLEKSNKIGVLERMRQFAAMMLQEHGLKGIEFAAKAKSDTLRAWASFAISQIDTIGWQEKFILMRPLADDGHFAVREWAWLAMRNFIVAEPKACIVYLEPWTEDPSENIRRFVVEATRPRGVWSKHVEILKTNPELGIKILEPLANDHARYVQNSVGNWLNDAAKTKPVWVKATCRRWKSEYQSKASKYIIKRSLRSLKEDSLRI